MGSCSGMSGTSSSSPRPCRPLAAAFRALCAFSRSAASTETLRKSCSKGPMYSTLPVAKLRTGRTSRPGPRKRKRPGKSRPARRVTQAISSSGCTPRVPSTLHCRRTASRCFSRPGSTWPRGQPSSTTQTCLPRTKRRSGQLRLLGSMSSTPRPASSRTTASEASGGAPLTTARAVPARWFSRPQGEPSGVCTGQRKPQVSGRSLRTVVVFICAKYCPRCTAAKCELKRAWFSLSATTV
mmetsp:Transcript_2477/g.7413  ORF Transcript_2477/g.7413 Transcript_2477/m.7413 type:complete len:239 (-) Transcript_2477:528-1244(-)